MTDIASKFDTVDQAVDSLIAKADELKNVELRLAEITTLLEKTNQQLQNAEDTVRATTASLRETETKFARADDTAKKTSSALADAEERLNDAKTTIKRLEVQVATQASESRAQLSAAEQDIANMKSEIENLTIELEEANRIKKSRDALDTSSNATTVFRALECLARAQTYWASIKGNNNNSNPATELARKDAMAAISKINAAYRDPQSFKFVDYFIRAATKGLTDQTPADIDRALKTAVGVGFTKWCERR